MERHAHVIAIRPEKVEEYERLHRAVWPDVLRAIHDCNIRSFSIFLRRIGGRHCLFSYYEYIGADYAADMARRAADPRTREWWELMATIQEPLADRAPGEWWAAMDEVFHMD